MTREYQYNYSDIQPSIFDSDKRLRKADTIVRVCQDFIGAGDLSQLHLLDVGSSSGIIDNYLANHFGQVVGIDIDAPAMAHARASFSKENLCFMHGDAMHIDLPDNSIDVVVCTQIYEHVPDAHRMVEEIFRVLKPGGFCYFSGNNRVMFMEPHHRLPFLSLLPRSWAHRYVRVTGKGTHYHELHFSYWALKRLCEKFNITDYSRRAIAEPEKFGVSYMITPRTLKWRVAKAIATYMPWVAPAMWILQKPRRTHPD